MYTAELVGGPRCGQTMQVDAPEGCMEPEIVLQQLPLAMGRPMRTVAYSATARKSAEGHWIYEFDRAHDLKEPI